MMTAQVTADWVTPLSTFGVGGVCLGFFMSFTWVWARRIETAMNRLTRANCLLVIALKQSNDEVRGQARSIIGEVDAAERAKSE